MSRVIPSIYRHTQAVASATWTITHNLGGNGSTGIPIVDCYVTDNGHPSKIIPASVTIPLVNNLSDKNSVVVTFSTPRAGEAIVVV